MIYILNLEEKTGRILSACYPVSDLQTGPAVEALPDGELSDYRYIDGKFIYEPLPQLPQAETADIPARLDKIEQLLKSLEVQTNDNTLAVAELYGGAI